jgi:hypothetical protein
MDASLGHKWSDICRERVVTLEDARSHLKQVVLISFLKGSSCPKKLLTPAFVLTM